MELNNYISIINEEPPTFVKARKEVSFRSKYNVEGAEPPCNINYLFIKDGWTRVFKASLIKSFYTGPIITKIPTYILVNELLNNVIFEDLMDTSNIHYEVIVLPLMTKYISHTIITNMHLEGDILHIDRYSTNSGLVSALNNKLKHDKFNIITGEIERG